MIALVIAASPVLAQQGPALVAAGPGLSIGSLDGAAPYLFEAARSGLLLSDGSVLVVDRHEMRLFDKTGVHLGTIGRTGEGPGEFKSIALVAETESGIRAYDWLQRRTTEFSLDGELLSTDAVRYPDADGSLSLIWSRGKGQEAYVVTRDTPRMSADDPDDYTVSKTTNALLVRSGDELAEYLAGSYERKYAARVGNNVYFGSEPLTSVLETSSGSSFVAAMPSDSDELRLIYPGREPVEIALDIEARDLGRAERRAFQEHFLAAASSEGRAAERELVLERMDWPSAAPRVDELKVDSDNRVWVGLFDFGHESTEWLLVNPDAGTRRRVTLPPQRELLDSRGERVLLRSVDDMGVPRVEVWSIWPAP